MGSVRRRIIISVATFVFVASAWMAYDPKGLRLWWNLGNDVSQMQSENAVLTAQLDVLHRRATALQQEPKALERAARENGYVRDGEILIELK